MHRAQRNSAAGFCVFNDIGITILQARNKYNIKKILYIDIDAHHGDGVYYEFDDNPDVYIADIHEDGSSLYPGTGLESENGTGKGKGTKLNLCLSPGATNHDFIYGLLRKLKILFTSLKCEIIIFQCGADGLKGDPLTHLQYIHNAHKYAAEVLHEYAHKMCNGRSHRTRWRRME